MSEQFHIIIAGDQNKPRSFRISKKNVIISATVSFAILSALFSTGFFTAGIYSYNKILSAQITSVQEKHQQSSRINNELERKLAGIIEQNNKSLAEIETKNRLLVTQIELESSRKIAELERINLEQHMSFKEERDLLLSTAVSELNARSEFIESVISDIGIKVDRKGKETQKNRGGPYIAAESANYDELLYKTDNYLKTIQALPLGKPTSGSVSSWYGKRKDPLNSKKAFHSGIDFRGKKGAPVIATADGKVTFAGNNGSFGKFIRIDHGNGYTTSFAHLHNYHVKKGDYVSRGQIIGLVGNSGRSTGSHLHYEISYKKKSVNPSKFMKVANLTCQFNTPLEK